MNAGKFENTMNKWFKILIYIMFIMIITYLVVTFAQASIVVDYLKDQENEIHEDPLKLISATAIANTHDGRDVYVLKDPLYKTSFISDSTSNSLSVSIYPFVLFNDDHETDMMAIVVSDFQIDDSNAVLDDDDYHILQAYITFDDTVTINDYEAQTFTETFVTTFDDKMKLLFVDVSLFEHTNIKDIQFFYPTEQGFEETLVTLSNSELSSINNSGIFDSSFDRDIKEVTVENLAISKVFSNDYETNTFIYYNASWLESLKDYNSYYIKYAIYEMLFVIPLTYLIFFHKQVRQKTKNNKALKMKAYKDRQEKYKKMYRGK